jgi:predicted metal-dependent hydrolase
VPLACIDYVITHELCHLKHQNHNRDFYFLLSQCMPDWRKRKERLETVLL